MRRRRSYGRDESHGGSLARLRAANSEWMYALNTRDPRREIAAIRRFIPEARAFGTRPIPSSEGGGTGNSRARSASRKLAKLRARYGAQVAKSRRGSRRTFGRDERSDRAGRDRKALIGVIFRSFPKDYRVLSGGKHKVMVMNERTGGTELETLENLSNPKLETFHRRYARDARRRPRSKRTARARRRR